VCTNVTITLPTSRQDRDGSQQFLKIFSPVLRSKHYNDHDFDNRFYPSLGSTISLSSVDTTNRNLDATFTTNTTNSSGTSISFLSGKIHIRNWEPFMR
jgi:hypothetical protein